jgi:DNA-binding response OmpR family regulator
MSVTILYAEDEVFLGKIVKESLESRGFSVYMETDGAKVFDLFKNTAPDVCVLDIMLPNKDGFEIAAAIRALNNQVPILFLTAKTQTDDVVRGFTLGGNDYIRKPFSMEELIVRIENVLRKKEGRPVSIAADTIQMGKFQFLSHRQLLVKDSTEKKLSYRETALLKLLYENRDGITDRKSILQQLWGNDSFFNSRNLDVYINKIRGYLKEDEKLEIVTIKGIGYRFIIG